VETRAAAELKAMLQGVALPSEKPALLEYAVRQHAEQQSLEALQSLPDREYESLDEVVEELLRVQPAEVADVAATPREESGAPPGGEDYVVANPADTGQVRD
jgi:hypothetical protein